MKIYSILAKTTTSALDKPAQYVCLFALLVAVMMYVDICFDDICETARYNMYII